jgi:hypothetical protein
MVRFSALVGFRFTLWHMADVCRSLAQSRTPISVKLLTVQENRR